MSELKPPCECDLLARERAGPFERSFLALREASGGQSQRVVFEATCSLCGRARHIDMDHAIMPPRIVWHAARAPRPGLDHPVVAQRYFFPRPQAPAAPYPVHAGDAVLACARRVVSADAPLVLHFHGNGEVVADYVPWIADLFAAAGLSTFFAEYRGFGGSTGTPALVGMLEDVEHIVRALDAPIDRVIAYGRSVGSIYAIEAVHRFPEIAGLVIESGIADPVERVLLRVRPDEIGVTTPQSIDQERRRHLDHERKLSAYGGPVLVLHAARDTLVDPTNAERLAKWAPRSELVWLDPGDHNTVLAFHAGAIVERVAALASIDHHSKNR